MVPPGGFALWVLLHPGGHRQLPPVLDGGAEPHVFRAHVGRRAVLLPVRCPVVSVLVSVAAHSCSLVARGVGVRLSVSTAPRSKSGEMRSLCMCEAESLTQRRDKEGLFHGPSFWLLCSSSDFCTHPHKACEWYCWPGRGCRCRLYPTCLPGGGGHASLTTTVRGDVFAPAHDPPCSYPKRGGVCSKGCFHTISP